MDAARSISDYSVLTERQEKNSGTIRVSKPSHTKEPIAPMGMRQLPHVRMVEFVYAHFGSQGLYCLTMTGKPVWNKDFR